VLEMGCGLAVASHYAPLVGCEVDRTVTKSDHRLDGDAHACFQGYSVAATSVVGNLRRLMHLPSYAVAGELAYNSISVGFAITLYGPADVADMIAGYSLLYSFVERCLGDAQQALNFVGDFAYTERVATVTVETVEQCSAINRDDVAFFQDNLITGYAMNDDLIHGGADAGGEWPSIGIGEVLEGGYGPVASDELLRDVIQMEGRYSGFDVLGQLCEGCPNQLVGLAHQFYFILCLEKDFHSAGQSDLSRQLRH